MKNLLNNLWKTAAAGSTVLAYQAWSDRVISAQKLEESGRKLDEIHEAVTSTVNPDTPAEKS